MNSTLTPTAAAQSADAQPAFAQAGIATDGLRTGDLRTGRNPSAGVAVHDQATDLRKLASEAARRRAEQAGPAPRTIVVSGALPGVGTTTLTINMAVVLAKAGFRVTVTETAADQSGIARICRLPERFVGVADVADARCDLYDAVLQGPAGVQLVAGGGGYQPEALWSEKNQRRVIEQIAGFGTRADIVLVDAGNGANDTVRQFWQAADDVILVTRPTLVAVMDAYATIKVAATQPWPRIRLIVNGAEENAEVSDAFERIDRSCRAYLDFGIESLGNIPQDSYVATAGRRAEPFMLTTPFRPASRELRKISLTLTSRLHHITGERDIA